MLNPFSSITLLGREHSSFTNENVKVKISTSTAVSKGNGDNAWLSLDGDGDVWVERRIKSKGKYKSYWRSVQTNDCVWNEPPTGASFIVCLDELVLYPFLNDFALGPLGKSARTIEPARKTPKKRGLFA